MTEPQPQTVHPGTIEPIGALPLVQAPPPKVEDKPAEPDTKEE